MRPAPIALFALLSLHCKSDADPVDETGGSSLGPLTGGSSGVEAGSDTSSSTGDASDGSGDAPTSSAAPTSGPGDTGSESTGDETSTGEPVEPPGVRLIGRHDASDPTHIRMGWSGVGAVFRFEGTGASVRLDDSGRYFTVLVDGELQPTLATQPGEQSYTLATGLPGGEHTIELYRRTEASFGPTVLLGVDVEGELLAPPPVTRRMEIIGDSITCGFGNEGVDPCPFTPETENHYRTYGAVAARALGAELSTVAWSGKGVVYNYDEDKNDPLPALYDRSVPTEASMWSFEWQPDVVVINLGTNDFSTDNDPPEGVFVPAYVQFLEHLRGVYPDAFILAIAPSLWGDEVALVAGYLQSAVDQRHAAGDLEVGFADVNAPWMGVGCSGHPSLATHAAMGENLTAAIQAELGW